MEIPLMAVGAGAIGRPQLSLATWLASAPRVISCLSVQIDGSFCRTGLGCSGELWDEVDCEPVLVGMADLDEDCVKREQLADASDAVDGIVWGVLVGMQSRLRGVGLPIYR